MPLTDVYVRNLKPQAKAYKKADGGGMYVFVQPDGKKYWRLAYRLHGKQKTMALGVYPQTTLGEARQKRDAAKKLLDGGVDPVRDRREASDRRQAEALNTFELVAREWHAAQLARWTPAHAKKILGSLEADVFPSIGSRPVSAVEAPELLAVLRKIENRGALEIVGRVHQRCSAVFRYAVATGRASRDPAADLRGALKAPARKHYAALSLDDLPDFLKRLGEYDGDAQTRLALRFMALTFVRTGELRGATWDEIDLDNAEWRVPASRMKMREAHLVPLSRQAVEVLRELHDLNAGQPLVFPSRNGRGKVMSENTILYALYRMGYHSRATGHGFRATASTILNEMGFSPDWIERQLAHKERNNVRAAYNRAQYLHERRGMMQVWADYLDVLATGEAVVPAQFRQWWQATVSAA